jgi:hypothetical protein
MPSISPYSLHEESKNIPAQQKNNHLGKHAHILESGIFVNAEIIIGVVCWKVVGDPPDSRQDLLVRAKT